MKIIKKGNVYHKAHWWQENENLAITLIIVVFYAVVMAAFLI